MVPNRSLIWILIACLLLTSCRSFASDSSTSDSVVDATAAPEISTPAPEHVARIRNTEYQLGAVDALRVVQLTDGKFEQGTPGGSDFVSIIVTDFITHGDLNGDGMDEYAALITENYGGSGEFVFLAVFSDVDGKISFLNSAWVDDRPQLNEFSIENEKIFLDATIHKSDEPMCCPSLHTARHYRLINNQLDMVDYVTFTLDDRPRTITIESPVSKTEVFNSVQIKGHVAIAPFENNLAYRIIDVGGVELAIGSLSVSAPDIGAPGTFDEDIALGNILSGALIWIEIRDVSAEDGLLFAMDSVELVIK